MRIRALNVAEKPSVAKAISEILGGNGLHRVPELIFVSSHKFKSVESSNPFFVVHHQRNGRSPYNHIFEFNYKIGGQDVEMHFTSVTGHLMGLDFGQQYTGWRSCDPLDLFTLPVFKTVPQVCQA
jgi:DNA topoisomerase-3